MTFRYGFKNVVTTADIYCACPEIWPFGNVFAAYHEQSARSLSKPLVTDGRGDVRHNLKIDAVLVFHEPRDWALDTAIIIDLLLSSQGMLGTTSKHNGDTSRPNDGYLQDGQPHIYFSNPDLWWAAGYHLARLGQGAFRNALQGLWAAVTGGSQRKVELYKTVIGKPSKTTYAFAEQRLRTNAKLTNDKTFDHIYMIGDNPESDIKGGNSFASPTGAIWKTILVQTGVYKKGMPTADPTAIQPDVFEAVNWALDDSAHGISR